MKILQLNASKWQNSDDFYNALFRALESPPWHGRNFNALRDSIITGQINRIELPYKISIDEISKTPLDVQELVRDFCDLIGEIRSEGYQIEIFCGA
jgi:RNAse (barnase) inhibitor barstar